MELKCMTKKIDQIANLWEKTKDPKYKDLWYKLIEEMHGLNNPERRTVSIDTSNQKDVRRDRTSKQWSNLVIELNLVAQAWKPYGPIIKMKAHNLDRIITWGKKTGDDKEDRRSSNTVEKNKRP